MRQILIVISLVMAFSTSVLAGGGEKDCKRDLISLFSCAYTKGLKPAGLWIGSKTKKYVWTKFSKEIMWEKVTKDVLWETIVQDVAVDSVYREAIKKALVEKAIIEGVWGGYLHPVYVQGIGKEVLIEAFGRELLLKRVYRKGLKPAGLFVADFGQDVYKEALLPFYEKGLKPIGIAVYKGVRYFIFGPQSKEMLIADEAVGLEIDSIRALPVYKIGGLRGGNKKFKALSESNEIVLVEASEIGLAD